MCANGRHTLFPDAFAMGYAALQPGIESLLSDIQAHTLVTTLAELSLIFLLALLDFVYLCSFNDKSSSNNTQMNGDECGWKRSWPVLWYCLEFAWRDKVAPRRTSDSR
jgi:hypothetical protein